MPRKKPKKGEIVFHTYVLHNVEKTDKEGSVLMNDKGEPITATYIIHSMKPLPIDELSALKPGETTAVRGDKISDALLQKTKLRALNWVDWKVFKEYGADLKKAIMFEGKIIDEVPVGISEQNRILNVVLRKAEGGKEIQVSYEGPVIKKEKDYHTQASFEVNPFTRKTKKA